MTETKFLMGHEFVSGLIDLGICDKKTRKVVIEAEVGSPVRLFIERYGDSRLLSFLNDGGITVVHDEEEAIAR